MNIGAALLWLRDRQYPIVRPEYSLITVLYLLRMRDMDAVPLTPRGQRSRRAVFGYSSLLKMVDLEPAAFAALLKGPCESASQALATRTMRDSLASLLQGFAARHLGFALVHDEGAKRETGSLVTLADLLELYRNRTLRTDLTVGDVASPILSIAAETLLRGALRTMLSRRMRRVFIEGESRCVSDRDIIYEVFSPLMLDEIGEGGKDPLGVTIGSIRGFAPEQVKADEPLPAAALRLGRERGERLVTGDGRLITPWDAVMKPWLKGRLTIAENAR